MDQRENNLPENPASPPSSLAVVLELSEDDLARVRRWLPHCRDKSIQVEIKEGRLHLKGIDPERLWRRIEMFELFGVDDLRVQQYLSLQVTAGFRAAAPGQEATQDQQEAARSLAWAILRGMGPRDQIEAMLAVQMLAVHNQAVEAMTAVQRVENPEIRKQYTSRAAKMLRIFMMQIEALKKYRGGTQQQMIIKRINVTEGGQAIVGQIETGRRNDQEDRA